MRERVIRIGNVSRINAEDGMAAITYPQLNDNTTVDVPVFAFTDEYKMPKEGSPVLVIHDPSGQCAAFILGHFWNRKNACPHTGAGVWRKELAHSYGEAFMDYDEDTGTLTIQAPKIKIRTATGDLTIDTATGTVIKAATSVAINAPATTNTGKYTGAGDVIGEGISLAHHVHPDPGTSGPA